MSLLSFKARKTLQAIAHHWHYRVLWFSAVAVFIWGCSGALHPVMTRLGPNPATMLPLPTVVDKNALQALPAVLAQMIGAPITRVRWVTLPEGLAIQVSESDSPRRHYFSAQDGSKFADASDEIYAMALARHFSANIENGIREATLITRFNDTYPPVNRLLPVYRIQFSDPRSTTLYIHTETSSLVSISNSRKEALQALFGKLHTLNFIDAYPWLRIPVILLFVGSLAFSAVTGIQLIISIRRKPESTSRWWHRKLALICCVPLLCFSVSGLHHLLQTSAGTMFRGKSLVSAVILPLNFSAASVTKTLSQLPAENWRDISLVENDSQLLLRVAAKSGAAGNMREQRFKSIVQDGEISYIDLISGKVVNWSDLQQARYLLGNTLKVKDQDVQSVVMLKNFTATYDFRNKRLPVWEARLSNNPAHLAYIDIGSNRIVEMLGRSEIIEMLDFFLLHNWNFLVFSIGRPARDALVLAVIALCLLLAAAGIVLRLKKSRR